MALSKFSKQVGNHSIIRSIKGREIQTSNLSKTCVTKDLGHSEVLEIFEIGNCEVKSG